METRFYVTLKNTKEGHPQKAMIEMPIQEDELRRGIRYVSNGGRDEVSIEELEMPRALEFIAALVGTDTETDIYHLNAIASLCSDVNSKESINVESIGLYTKENKVTSMKQLANVLMQAVRIPYYAYGEEECEIYSEIFKPEVIYGYMQTNPAGLDGLLRETDIVDHLHYAQVGREAVSRDEVLLGERGYLDKTKTLLCSIRLDAYDWEDIYKAAGLESPAIMEIKELTEKHHSMGRLESPELDPAIQPVVTILWSESDRLREGEQMLLAKADLLFRELDAEQYDKPGCNKTQFSIAYTLNGELSTYEGRQDFGDGDGSMIAHIKAYHKRCAKDEHWKNDVLHYGGGPEAWKKAEAEHDMILEELVPYMQLHCSLAGMEQAAADALDILSKIGEPDGMERADIAYHTAIQAYIAECRHRLNTATGEYHLPERPQKEDFTDSVKDIREAESAHTGKCKEQEKQKVRKRAGR